MFQYVKGFSAYLKQFETYFKYFKIMDNSGSLENQAISNYIIALILIKK
jgi:hypothetical protein